MDNKQITWHTPPLIDKQLNFDDDIVDYTVDELEKEYNGMTNEDFNDWLYSSFEDV